MEFKFIQDEDRDDFGGSVAITAKGTGEIRTLCKHFRLFDDPFNLDHAEAYKAAIIADTITHIMKTGNGRENGAYFEFDTAMELEWSKPYVDEINKRTGWGIDILPDVELTHAYDSWMGLHHTHYIAGFKSHHGHFCFRGYVANGDWNGKTASQLSEPYMMRGVNGEIGTSERIEKIMTYGTGRNSDVLSVDTGRTRTIESVPAVENKGILRALLQHWLDTEANDAQKEWVRIDEEVMKKNRCSSNFFDIKGPYGLDRGWLRKGWETEDTITMQQFINLT